MAKKLKVLVIDDSKSCAQLFDISLRSRGHAVTVALTLDAALFALSAGSFDAIVCDLLLPDGNGCEIMPHLRSRKDPVFAVAVSGLGGLKVEEDAIAAGFDKFVRKPFRLQDVIAVIETNTF